MARDEQDKYRDYAAGNLKEGKWGEKSDTRKDVSENSMSDEKITALLNLGKKVARDQQIVNDRHAKKNNVPEIRVEEKKD